MPTQSVCEPHVLPHYKHVQAMLIKCNAIWYFLTPPIILKNLYKEQIKKKRFRDIKKS